ncbi:MAG: hypothetical protein RR482_04345 [Clostridia bacterium]
MTMLWFPVPVRPWVFHVFIDKKNCYGQYCDYTFSKRLGWKPWRVHLVAWIGALLVPPLMRSAGAVPVYRKSLEAMKTVRQSVRCLLAGESVIIYPDIAYTEESDEMGDMYEGFLLMERSYRHARDQHLPFVPLYVDDVSREIRQGAPVLFADDVPFADDLKRVSGELRERINDMAEEAKHRADARKI